MDRIYGGQESGMSSVARNDNQPQPGRISSVEAKHTRAGWPRYPAGRLVAALITAL